MELNWEMWAAVLALGTLIATLGGFGLAQGRATRKTTEAALKRLAEDVNQRFEGQRAVLNLMDAKNEQAHAAITTRVDGVSGRVDGVTAQVDGVAGRVDRLTSKLDGLTSKLDGLTSKLDGLTAQVGGLTGRVDGVAGRVDRLTSKLDVVAHDVAFLAGRQKERDHQDGR